MRNAYRAALSGALIIFFVVYSVSAFAQNPLPSSTFKVLLRYVIREHSNTYLLWGIVEPNALGRDQAWFCEGQHGSFRYTASVHSNDVGPGSKISFFRIWGGLEYNGLEISTLSVPLSMPHSEQTVESITMYTTPPVNFSDPSVIRAIEHGLPVPIALPQELTWIIVTDEHVIKVWLPKVKNDKEIVTPLACKIVG